MIFVTVLFVELFMTNLFNMQITQRVTTHCIMSVYEAAYFVAYNNKR